MNEELKNYSVLSENERDPRDYNIARFIPGKDKIEDVEFILDLPELEIILNQCYGSCVGHAFVIAKSINEYQKTHKWIDFCPYMLYGTRYDGEYNGPGMYLRQGAKVLYKDGAFFRRDFGKASEMPQLQDEVEDFKKNNPSLVNQAKNFCIEGYAFVNTIDEIKTALKAGMPVVINIEAWADMGNKDGIVKLEDTSNDSGNHAVCVIGWRMIDGETYLIIINSWGIEYGYKGLLFFNANREIYDAISISDTITPIKEKCKCIEFSIGSSVFKVDGEEKVFESVPYIKDDRTYLPVRFVAENLGASVEWDAETGVAVIRSEEAIITLSNKKNIIHINGEAKGIEVCPEIINDRMMLPIRFIAEALNCKVTWNHITRKITIKAL